jgi:uncharacterized protein (TIGR03435 family)
MIRAIALLSLAAWTSSSTPAQSFEVAAIKLHTGEVASVGISTSGPRVTVSAMSVSNLVRYAYDLKNYQVAGGPDWASSDRWDIFAKGEGGGLTRGQVRKMIEALLADRFQVKLHREAKEMAVYALIVGKGGPKLRKSAPDTTSRLMMDGTRTTRITTTNGSMEQLVAQLSGHMDRPVLDKTRLTGSYDYKLEWASVDAPPDVNVASIFSALQEQLGLKLESTKGAIEILVIDHVEKPPAN